MAFDGHFKHPRLRELAKAGEPLGFGNPDQRRELLAAVNQDYVKRVFTPVSLPPLQQVLSDLVKLNEVRRLSDNSVPLMDWLDMAVWVSEGREEGTVFRAAYDDLTSRLTGQPAVPAVNGAPAGQEKIIYRNDMVPFPFLAAGGRAGDSVALLRVPRIEGGVPRLLPTGDPELAFGTTWVLGERLLITNHHVVAAREQGEPLPSEADFLEQAAGAEAVFGFDGDGEFGDVAEIEKCVAADRALDYAVLCTKAPLPRPPLARAPERLPQLRDGHIPVNIIQHPWGRPKRVAIRNNLVTRSDERDLRYLTDTAIGSSGSPVFDDRWQVVALHRAFEADEEIEFLGHKAAWVNVGTQLTAVLTHIEENAPDVFGMLSAP